MDTNSSAAVDLAGKFGRRAARADAADKPEAARVLRKNYLTMKRNVGLTDWLRRAMEDAYTIGYRAQAQTIADEKAGIR